MKHLMNQSYETLTVDLDDGIARVTFRRDKDTNAFCRDMTLDLTNVCRMVAEGDKICANGHTFMLQQGIAQFAGGIFNADFAAGRKPAHIGLPHGAANAQFFA